ncbi:hypothetical protein PtB15_2B593 [Puccinia triticina]|nr:hypothetical protein PtB15_2B593 [Puccinia triticina]
MPSAPQTKTTVGPLRPKQPTQPSQRPLVGFLIHLNDETIMPDPSEEPSQPTRQTTIDSILTLDTTHPARTLQFPKPSLYYLRPAPNHDSVFTFNVNGLHVTRRQTLSLPRPAAGETQPPVQSRGLRTWDCPRPFLDKPNQSSHELQPIENASTLSKPYTQPVST